ncbi:MAG: ABC transporter ATP-binding protein [Candidatus Dormibacteria bacterium]
MSELRCTGLTKTFGSQEVISHLDLTVPDGSIVAIVGPSGSGKTTLLRSILGLVAIDEGTIHLGDRELTNGHARLVPPHRRAIGYVPQEGALFPHSTVMENVGFGLPRAQRKDVSNIDKVLSLVGLNANYRNRRPHELSGGEQRRVALARALAPSPSCVVLDEPFTGLDASLRQTTRTAVAAALRATQATAVFVTHDQQEAFSLGDYIGILRKGAICQFDTPEEVYRQPADLDTAQFLGETNILTGSVTRNHATSALGKLPVLGHYPDGPAHILIRPEQLHLHGSARPDDSDMQVHGRIISITFFGAHSLLSLAVNGIYPKQIIAHHQGHAPWDVGEQVYISLTGRAACYPTSKQPANDPVENTERTTD